MITKLNQIRQQLSAYPGSELLVVSKGWELKQIKLAFNAGQQMFAESYAQELLEKLNIIQKTSPELKEIKWHFLGKLQKNKVKKVVPLICCLHSLDSLALAEVIERALESLQDSPQKILDVFIQVKLSSEVGKTGVLPKNLYTLAAQVSKLSRLNLLGLMGIPHPKSNPEKQFRYLRELEEGCRPFTQSGLSMGMSQDYRVALQEKATIIRIGTALRGSSS